MAVLPVTDAKGDWMRQAFMIPRLRATQLDSMRKKQAFSIYYSKLYGTSGLKFTDTSIGGNFAINTPPQFCRYTDIPPNKETSGGGMGRYYSEAIDDYAQLVHVRFGVPEYNSLTTFFTGFYNAEASLLARKGRSTGVLFAAGKVLGTVASIPLAPIIGVGSFVRWLGQMPASKFYYLKPTMSLYWTAVNTIANSIAINMGIYPKPMTTEEITIAKAAGETEPFNLGANELSAMNSFLPNVYWKGGGIDVYNIANRATRMAHKQRQDYVAKIEAMEESTDIRESMIQFMNTPVTDPGARTGTGDDGESLSAIDVALRDYLNSKAGRVNPPNESDTGIDTGRAVGNEDPENPGLWNTVTGWYDELIASGASELSDGAAFVTYHVDHTGTASESISNSVRDSDIASTMNSTAASARNSRFNFAEGNVSGGIGGLLSGVVSGLKDVVSGAMEGLEISGLGALAGSAFVDIPKHWDNSQVNLPTMSYTIRLQAWSGDKYTRFQALVMPLATLLAGALPRSTGQASYTSPFICELYSKGRAQTRLGIITDMSITRGTGNIGWTREQEPLGIDVTFTVTDLSSIMHMPIAGKTSINPFEGLFAEDTAFNDYMAVLGSLGMADQIYVSKRFRLSMARKMVSFKQWTSPAKWASWAVGTAPGRLVNAISREVARP